MSAIDVYLEVREDGQCIAHVLALPGCFVVGNDQEAALNNVSEAVQGYASWLEMHEKTITLPDQLITLTVAETLRGVGALHPGDQMALFSPEKKPLSREELARLLQLAAYNRADLLAAVRGLSGTMRGWRPGPDRMSIDDILRHIGRADRWYVSRLKGTAELPEDWFAFDDQMPVMQFLRLMRETAVSHFQHLSDDELSRITTPTYRTQNPTEQWTARKALRRFLEHEREHLAHIHENLALWRQQFKARLAAERAHFLLQYRSLSEDVLTQQPVVDDWTAKALLPHVGAWDAFHTERLDLVHNGRLSDIEILGETILNDRNAQLHQKMKDIPLEQAFALCLKERGGYKAMLNRVSDADLHRTIRMPNGERSTIAVWANRRWRHDMTHGDELAAWRNALPRDILFGTGPKYLLTGILNASRKAFLELAPMLSEQERHEKLVCGEWTLKDLVGHLADWEMVGVGGLQKLSIGQLPEYDEIITDFDLFNSRHAAIRKDQPWSKVWSDFESTRKQLLDLLARVTDDDLKRPFTASWGPTIHGYYLTVVWAVHEMEHSVDVRQALQLPNLPKRLRKHD